MADSIDVVLYGTPLIGEVRQRAVYELKRDGRHIESDCEITVTRTARSPRLLTVVTTGQAVVEQVILAALQCKTIRSRRVIRSLTYRRAYVDGIDSTTVSFRPCHDRLLVA